MFKSKSFDLNNEDVTKQSKNLYQPRKARWLKYIMQPAAIAFVLILIICNVDFSDDPDDEKNVSLTKVSPSDNNYLSILPVFKYAKQCTLTCNSFESERNLNNLFCECVEKNKLQEEFVKSKTSNGEYKLESLTLSNFHLIQISDGAFDHNSLHNLTNLELIDTRLQNITNEAFRGLNKLSNFTLINKSESLRCRGFMLPVANSLKSAKISQQYTNYNIYKPDYFFGDVVYNHLKVLDLRGNNFGGAVETESFINMPVLEYLILADCRLSSIKFHISNGGFYTLRYVDLSGNMLTELDPQFLLVSMQLGVSLNLVDNNWNCTYIKLLKLKPCLKLSIKRQHLRSIDTTDDFDKNYSTNALKLAVNIETSSTKHLAPPKTSRTTTSLPILDTSTPTTPIEETTPTTEQSQVTTIGQTTPTTIQNDVNTPWTTDTIPTAPTTLIPNNDDSSVLVDHLICFDPVEESTQSTSISYNGQIKIEDDSESSVYVILSQLKSEVWSIAHFSNAKLIAQTKKEDVVDMLDVIRVKIQYLSCATSYLFCLIIEDNTTPPFNCRSHRTISCKKQEKWFQKYQVPIVSCATVVILLSLAIGIFGTYGVLWMRPTWLWGSRRLVRYSHEPYKMILLPKSYDEGLHKAKGLPRTEGDITEYATYYRHLEKAQLYQGEPNKYNVPPLERAPSIPPSVEKVSTNPNTYTYECFELYEEIC